MDHRQRAAYCAENKLMAGIHDEYRLTGTSRTWPNLLTAEGVSGDEACSSAEHTAALPSLGACADPSTTRLAFTTSG